LGAMVRRVQQAIATKSDSPCPAPPRLSLSGGRDGCSGAFPAGRVRYLRILQDETGSKDRAVAAYYYQGVGAGAKGVIYQ